MKKQSKIISKETEKMLSQYKTCFGCNKVKQIRDMILMAAWVCKTCYDKN
tara:strand:- start:936 stop:1085 length:150 start_codon:yes stop_codon:yes gene_type:complete